jgi:hypothetical protein
MVFLREDLIRNFEWYSVVKSINMGIDTSLTAVHAINHPNEILAIIAISLSTKSFLKIYGGLNIL